jgi:hypothetical protein
MQFHRWRISLLALLLVCASCSGKNKDEGGETSDTPQGSASAGTDAGVPPQAQAKELDALVDVIVAEAAKLPHSEFDPAALAARLGKDPQAHFEWVRDHTWWAPYRGLLRGSKGVMLDRVGSNLDRAVLLGDLLRRAGHTVRLAHAEIPEARARELLGKLRPIPEQRRRPPASPSISAERQRAIEEILPKEGESLQEQIADSKRRTDEARSLARLQADQLLATVKGAATGDATADRRAMAALQDHWWVERSDSGKWIAMDVLLPDAKAGDTLAAASQTSEWKADLDAPSIPDSNWHSVQVRVVLERYADGDTRESTLLETVLRPAEVFDRPVLLTHFPKPWPELPPDTKADPNAVGNAAVSVKEWVPFLQVGDEMVSDSGFTESGDLIAEALDPKRDIAKTGGGGFMSGFGESLGEGATSSSSVTAEWIDYEIRVPGESGQRLRRPVFDLLGPARRSAKATGFDPNTNDRLIERYEALLSLTDIFLQPCDIPEEYLAHLATRNIVANQAAFRELAREPDPAKASKLAATLSERLDTWGPLPSLAYWRSELGGQPQTWFIDRPNVLNYRIGLPAVNADRIVVREMTDIAANSIGVRQGAGRSPFEVRLRQGVTDTVAEMLALGSEPGKAANTSSIFAAAGAAANGGRRIGPGDAVAVQSLGWPEDAAARLAKDIDAGFMAVALAKPLLINERERVGWWRVSPETGETIGVMDTGFHASEEYSRLIQLMNALKNFLQTNARAIRLARRAAVLTPGQSWLLRAAVAAEQALEAFASSRRPF